VGAEVAAVCDVYEPNLQAGLKLASAGAKSYDDYRRLLEDRTIEAVVIATPDHWHARMVIDAVEAGKDAYLEKPFAHTVEEGFAIVEAVRRTKRVVQVGTQRRSSALFLQAKRAFESASIGEVRLVNSWWYNHQPGLQTAPLTGKLDWKQWLGSAPGRDVNPERFRNWYYFYDYSGGLMIGQAAHVVDAIQWFMNSGFPTSVTATGGQVNLKGAEIPETTCMCLEFPENYLAVFTVGYKAMRYASFNDQLKQFHGSKARFDMGRESYALYPEAPKDLELKPSMEFRRPGSFAGATRSHIRNFLDCVRSRQEPNAAVEMGNHTNVALCMAVESLRTGRKVRFNAAARRMET
jgi:predicted dehydrogenase